MPNVLLKYATGANLSLGTYTDAGGNLALGNVPLVAGLPVATANPLPVVVKANPLLTETLGATTIVAAAQAVSVVAANANRVTLGLINTGAADAYFGYSSAVTAANGWPLYAGGGGFTWGRGEAPAGAIFVFSAAGTTIVAKEGV